MNRKPRVTVVIVNYRVPDDTILAVESALASSCPVSVVVVENDSPDDSYARLAAAQQRLSFRLHRSARNGGYAYGCNRGFESADPDSEYVFFLNPDARVERTTVETLVDHMEARSHVGVVGAQLVNDDGVPRSSAWRFPSVLGELDRGARLGPVTRLVKKATVALPLAEQPTEVDWVTGAAFMIRRRVVETIGPMDENFFLYYEETDWCWRAKKAGWTVETVPRARVLHYRGKSTGVTGEETKPLPDCVYESRRYLFKKHNGPAYLAAADLSYLSGAVLWMARRMVERKPWDEPPQDLRKMVRSMLGRVPDPPREAEPPAGKGASNLNPPDIHLLELLWEDFNTHERSLVEAGFWALAVHRLGNARMDVRRPFRAPLTAGYRLASTAVRYGLGIKLDYTVQVGRRLRIWHHGGMVIGAQRIGDDVHLRQNTTIGTASRKRPHDRPTLQNGVDVGSGACIVGRIDVGHHARIGANAVVAKDVPPFGRVTSASVYRSSSEMRGASSASNDEAAPSDRSSTSSTSSA